VVAPVEDGQQLKSPTEVVSNVLPRSSLFLCNVGLQSASKKSSTSLVSVKVQQLQDQLEIKRQEKVDFGKELKH
jgi:hypothetical protein